MNKKYRKLRVGEIIREGDEWRNSGFADLWRCAGTSIGTKVNQAGMWRRPRTVAAHIAPTHTKAQRDWLKRLESLAPQTFSVAEAVAAGAHDLLRPTSARGRMLRRKRLPQPEDLYKTLESAATTVEKVLGMLAKAINIEKELNDLHGGLSIGRIEQRANQAQNLLMSINELIEDEKV